MIQPIQPSCQIPQAASPVKPSGKLSEKIESIWKKVFGYILRISVFQLGEINTRGAYTIIRTYQRATSDPREEKPFDLERLARANALLKMCGGVESILYPEDGKAAIRAMTFKSKDFFHHFEQMGAEKKTIEYIDPKTGEKSERTALIPNEKIRAPELKSVLSSFYKKMHEFRYPLINLETSKGIVKGALLPPQLKLEPGQQAPCIFHIHSPGRSMCMEKSLLGLLLGSGYDTVMYDPRGTAESVGKISEGGAYLDAECVFKHTLTLGYPYEKIYISGFCEGAAMGAHLLKKYHPLGVHFIAANPFDSMASLVDNHGKFAKSVRRHAIPGLISDDPAIASRVEQNGLDMAAKLQGLEPSSGRFIILPTIPDQTVAPDSIANIRKAIGNAGPIIEIPAIHLNAKNAHTIPPYRYIWDKFVEVIK